MLRRVALFAFVVLALIVASSVPAGAKKGARPDVPMKGSVTSVESSFSDVIPVGRCPTIAEDTVAISSFSGYGTATHLGRFTWESSHCTSGGSGFYGDGFMTIVAANGDILEAVYGDGVVLGVPPVLDIADQITFVDGGTGRFAYASGGVFEVGTFDFGTLQVNLDWSGRIAYGR